MKVDVHSHLMEKLLWLQRELETQPVDGKDHPVFQITDTRGGLAGVNYMTRYMAIQHITKPGNSSFLTVKAAEGAANPEWVFLRELILSLDLSAYRKDTASLAAALREDDCATR